MKITCDVILDLIPLVKDGVASDDSTQIVHEHLKSCQSCQAEYDLFETPNVTEPRVKDEKIIFAIKRSIFITQLTILLIGAIIGIALTNSMGMFYNFLIMPLIGAISFFIFKRKVYWALVAIFILSFIWQLMTVLIIGEFAPVAFTSSFTYSIIYTILVGLGVVIAFLLKFAFQKG